MLFFLDNWTFSFLFPFFMKWIFFSHSLPADPSKKRVFVWRQLKKLGAVNYQSVWVLPFSRERVEALKQLLQFIEENGGEGLIIEGKSLTQRQEERIQRVFIESRNQEYRELIEKCEDFFREIDFEIQRRNFIFVEVEENEEELEKLKLWLKKVRQRDVLGAPLYPQVLKKIKACEKRFEEFARKVYTHVHFKKSPPGKIGKKGRGGKTNTP